MCVALSVFDVHNVDHDVNLVFSFSHPPANKLSSVVRVSLYPEKDTPSELRIKAYVGKPVCSQFHVFEEVCLLPQFSLYVPCGLDVSPSPQGSVIFNLSERLDRVRWGLVVFDQRPDYHYC